MPACTIAYSAGEAPYASHALYMQPGVLDDEVPSDRVQGVEAGLAWAEHADIIAVYLDFGWTSGMKASLARHKLKGKSISERRLSELPVDAVHTWREHNERRRNRSVDCPKCGARSGEPCRRMQR